MRKHQIVLKSNSFQMDIFVEIESPYTLCILCDNANSEFAF